MEFFAPAYEFQVGDVVEMGPYRTMRITEADGIRYQAEPTRDARREAEQKARRERVKLRGLLARDRMATACFGARQ